MEQNISSGGATAKRYTDVQLCVMEKPSVNIDERIQLQDYSAVPYYNNLYQYTSSQTDYRYRTLDNRVVTFKDTISEDYLTYRHIYKPIKLPNYVYEIQNYSNVYGFYHRICRARKRRF